MSGNTFESFGPLLKRLRLRQRLTQQQLADRVGVHRNTIGRWEEGSYLPDSKALVLELARCLHLEEPETRQLLDASLLSPTFHWSVPYPRNPFFTGREDILAALHARLDPDQPVALTQSYALHGLGGIGKTQIALEYAYRYALKYRAIFWIGAETSEQIHASLLRIAEHLDLPERKEADQQRIVVAVQRWLETHGEWLLIWDNLEDLDLLRNWLPFGTLGVMMITTRNQALGPLAHGMDLALMGKEESLLFLLRRARLLESGATSEQVQQFAQSQPGEYAAAVALITALGGLPLALDQAGAYVEETGCRLLDYQHRYEQQRRHVLGRRGLAGADHPQSVTATFVLASERIEREQRAAAAVLRVCAFMHAEAIPEEFFGAGAAYFGPEVEALASNPLQFDEAIALLRRYSLVQRDPSTRTLSLHRLVQAVLREAMSPQEQSMWLRRVITAFDALFPEITPEAWDQCERLLPHVLASTASADQAMNPRLLAECLRKAADYLRVRAHYEQAEPLYQQAWHLLELDGEPERLSVARLFHSRAILSRLQGKYQQAQMLGEQSLRMREELVGPLHLEVAASLNHLATLAIEQGQYEQAQRLHLRVLSMREQLLGPEHPELAGSLNNVANLYNIQGKYEQAETMHQRALHIWQQTFGTGHPQVAYSLNNLALLYVEQGKDEQAEPMYHQALAIWEQALGAEHPLVAELLNNLARLYATQGKDAQAEPMYQRALSIWKQAFGAEHPQLAEPLSGLAHLFQKQGNEEQAEALYQQALALREHSRGENHPETAQTLYDLALFRHHQRKLHEALSLAERALKIQVQSLGKDHPKTIAVRDYRALLLREIASRQNSSAQDLLRQRRKPG